MIEVKVSGTNAAEVFALLQDLVNTNQAKTTEVVEVKIEEKKEKKPKKETKKNIIEETVKASDASVKGAEDTAKVITVDDVRDALQAVNSKHGMTKVKEILGEFAANKLSDLNASDYSRFVEVCGAC